MEVVSDPACARHLTPAQPVQHRRACVRAEPWGRKRAIRMAPRGAHVEIVASVHQAPRRHARAFQAERARKPATVMDRVGGRAWVAPAFRTVRAASAEPTLDAGCRVGAAPAAGCATLRGSANARRTARVVTADSTRPAAGPPAGRALVAIRAARREPVSRRLQRVFWLAGGRAPTPVIAARGPHVDRRAAYVSSDGGSCALPHAPRTATAPAGAVFALRLEPRFAALASTVTAGRRALPELALRVVLMATVATTRLRAIPACASASDRHAPAAPSARPTATAPPTAARREPTV